jgi:hypothetical protein
LVNSSRVLSALRRVYIRSRLRSLIPGQAKVALRGQWIGLARRVGYPISSPLFPRPRLDRHRRAPRLSHVLIACDLNPGYLDFWPSTQRAWKEIVGIEAVLVLIASRDRVPADLREDPAVIQFEPIEGMHSAFQAQCIRLLYPALIETDGAVIVSDIDLYPLRASYFHDPLRLLDERFFISYRDWRVHAYPERHEWDLAFNAALPTTWGEVFEVATVDDVSRELKTWAEGLYYDGRRGWDGWYTDQQKLYEKLTAWPQRARRLWVMDDQYCGYCRLNRDKLINEDGIEPWRLQGIRALEYSDFSCFIPFDEHREANNRILELGIEVSRSQQT